MGSSVILLVEDNPADIRLTREAFRERQLSDAHVHVVKDGVEAINFLTQQGQYADAPRPNLILLDLNLPRKDGREVLAEIKRSPELRRIPVVILTTSQSEADVLRTYDLHANCFITKPVDLNRFLDVVKAVEDFWLSAVTLPTS